MCAKNRRNIAREETGRTGYGAMYVVSTLHKQVPRVCVFLFNRRKPTEANYGHTRLFILFKGKDHTVLKYRESSACTFHRPR